MSVQAIVWFLRVMVFVLPAVVALIAWSWCRGLAEVSLPPEEGTIPEEPPPELQGAVPPVERVLDGHRPRRLLDRAFTLLGSAFALAANAYGIELAGLEDIVMLAVAALTVASAGAYLGGWLRHMSA